MGTIDDIRPLAPTPSSPPIDHRREDRKQRQDKPASQPRRQPKDETKDADNSPPHIDEYA